MSINEHCFGTNRLKVYACIPAQEMFSLGIVRLSQHLFDENLAPARGRNDPKKETQREVSGRSRGERLFFGHGMVLGLSLAMLPNDKWNWQLLRTHDYSYRSMGLHMDHGRPKKFIDCQTIDQNRQNKERYFRSCQAARAVPNHQQKHPGQQNHGVTIRKLPAARIAMTPEDESQDPDRGPPMARCRPPSRKRRKRKGEATKMEQPKAPNCK